LCPCCLRDLHWLEYCATKKAANAAQEAAQAASDNANMAAYALTESEIASEATLQQMAAQSMAQEHAAEAAKSSAQTAQQSLHIGERPYVTPFDPVFLQDPEHSLTAVQVRLAFLNSGRTPAIRTQAKLRIFIDDNELPQIVKFPAAITIASERSCSVDFEITKRDLTGVTEGTRLFYVKGTVSYTDVFKADNSTTFCSVYDAHSKTFKLCGDMVMK
jgi:hypothetical protein